ncbi:MAG TPA: hypothetical protein VGI60_01550 [Chthoniobacterales bacterium]|jgi:hypothetical protein
MPEEKEAPDLLDLKFLPAWVREAPNENAYADYVGEEHHPSRERGGSERRADRRERGPRPPRQREKDRRTPKREREPGRDARPSMPHVARASHPETPTAPAPAVTIRFVPDARVLASVLAQIKSSHLAYSVFSLARMFLDKPERYDVQLKSETAELFQLGENGSVASDRRVLENGAFLSEKNRFYRTEVTQSEPIKGNFTSVARCRLSGTLLGPTNHHAYQSQLRNLYEQRFSRRMSFPEYQRQIEIVNDPEIVERWKEEARSLTTYVTLQEDPPITFNSAAETERHFRQIYLPALLRGGRELTIDGVVSRRLPDRSLGRVIEQAWAQEFRSPAKVMQELSNAFRQGALQIFRHRKSMLFVSSIRARPFNLSSSSLSSSVAGVLAALGEAPGINRKQLLEKLQPESGSDPEARERNKRALVSDLHWLISEGHVVEFNDGSLDVPRPKAATKPTATPEKPGPDSANGITEPVSANEPAGAAEVSPNEQSMPEEHHSTVTESGPADPVQAESVAEPEPEPAPPEPESSPAPGGLLPPEA